jgi:2-polyprenyl-3-methyl-5-hydroxy-6-metoxy-1,4-benzoquinol methylase
MNIDDIREALRAAYDSAADLREGSRLQSWKAQERNRFLDLLRMEGASSLLEVGAGTGVHGAWFAQQGLHVVATDLSPVMVEHCLAKGLEAYEMAFLDLDFDEPFDAVFGMNCLLHVPRIELHASLESNSRLPKSRRTGLPWPVRGHHARRPVGNRPLPTEALLQPPHG